MEVMSRKSDQLVQIGKSELKKRTTGRMKQLAVTLNGRWLKWVMVGRKGCVVSRRLGSFWGDVVEMRWCQWVIGYSRLVSSPILHHHGGWMRCFPIVGIAWASRAETCRVSSPCCPAALFLPCCCIHGFCSYSTRSGTRRGGLACRDGEVAALVLDRRVEVANHYRRRRGSI